MEYQSRTVALKNGAMALLRAPREQDAVPMLEFMRLTARETDFLLRYPEEYAISPEREWAFLNGKNQSPLEMMIVCEVGGEIAGNCHLGLSMPEKTRHRASVAIALRSKFWGLGIGTLLLNELEAEARRHDVRQLELDYVDGNTRALGLYRKLGYEAVARKPDAIRLRDGTLLDEISMVKRLK